MNMGTFKFVLPILFLFMTFFYRMPFGATIVVSSFFFFFYFSFLNFLQSTTLLSFPSCSKLGFTEKPNNIQSNMFSAAAAEEANNSCVKLEELVDPKFSTFEGIFLFLASIQAFSSSVSINLLDSEARILESSYAASHWQTFDMDSQ